MSVKNKTAFQNFIKKIFASQKNIKWSRVKICFLLRDFSTQFCTLAWIRKAHKTPSNFLSTCIRCRLFFSLKENTLVFFLAEVKNAKHRLFDNPVTYSEPCISWVIIFVAYQILCGCSPIHGLSTGISLGYFIFTEYFILNLRYRQKWDLPIFWTRFIKKPHFLFRSIFLLLLPMILTFNWLDAISPFFCCIFSRSDRNRTHALGTAKRGFRRSASLQRLYCLFFALKGSG